MKVSREEPASGSEFSPTDYGEQSHELARDKMITAALTESKTWLAVATKGTDPTPVAEFKAWAATVAEMTRQKGLAHDIQLDAQEMVRRAERGIGLTVRNGQAAGDIQRNGGDRRSTSYPDQKTDRAPASSDFLKPGNEMSETYDLTDDVTDDQFDQATCGDRAPRSTPASGWVTS